VIDDALREELSALLDGVLPEERAKELRRRIREEPELFREYAELERAVLAVRALPRKPAPPELRARLRRSLGERRGRGRIFRLGALAVAATALLATGLALYLRREAPVHYEATGEPRDARKDVARNQAPADAGASSEVLKREDTKALGEGKLDKARDAVAAEAQPSVGGPKGERRNAEQKEQSDLLAAAVKSHAVPTADRKAYLREVAALGAEGARAHVRAVIGEELSREKRVLPPGARGGGPPVLATVLLEDREEANLVKKILDRPLAKVGQASVKVEEETKDQLSVRVSGTPDDLRRLKQWLALLDLASAADAMGPRIRVLGEPPREEEEAEPKAEAAVVRLRFGKTPQPMPAEAPPQGK